MKSGENYKRILEEIETVAGQCGRKAAEITLVSVSKTESAAAIDAVFQAGCVDFGENRVQEALSKISELAATPIRWHLIGSLQKNKVSKAIGKFHLIHSVDSFELAEKISRQSLEVGCITSILLQINTSGEMTKHGFSGEELESHLDKLQTLEGISLEGLMTMAPFDATESEIARYFGKLRKLRDKHQSRSGSQLSMGMSHDYKIAIAEGATLLRIGTAIFKK